MSERPNSWGYREWSWVSDEAGRVALASYRIVSPFVIIHAARSLLDLYGQL